MTDDYTERRAVLDRLAAYDTPTLLGLEALLTRAARVDPADSGKGYLAYLRPVAASDVRGLVRAEQSYGDSWKRRGGVDTYEMLERKWNRLEGRVAASTDGVAAGAPAPALDAASYDLFEHVAADRDPGGVIDDVRDLRRYLMLVEAEVRARASAGLTDSGRAYLDRLAAVAETDVRDVEAKEASHGSSWKRGGGIGAFMILARKWDRIRLRVQTRVAASDGAPGARRGNVFEHVAADRRAEGVLDDVGDLRRFLLLVEAEMAARGAVGVGTARDDREGAAAVG